ncbi:MAG: immune inhibitor A, partial [Bacteroidetes bacterium]|nr:immune inhibitor A [Bacteroidota bacterium]
MFFNSYYVFFNSKIILGIILISLVATATAHTPPQGDDASVLNSTSDIDERFRRMHRLETYRVGAGLKQRVLFKLNRARLEAAGLSPSEIALALNRGPLRAFPFQANPELASTGAVRTLTLLIDFEDHQADDHLPGLTAQRISQNIYGSGTSEAQDFVPFESAHEYYRRASEGTLDLQGDVIGWIRLAKNRSEYEPQYPIGASEQQIMRIDNQALFDLISTALDEVDANTDFSQYDNDHDGDIDLITVMYAGPNNGWGGFWWAYRWEFFIPEAFTKKFDGKRLKQFVFQFVKQR